VSASRTDDQAADRLGAGAAPGKVILFGEHAVVYGQPAIAAALSVGLGATCEPHCEPRLRIPAWGKSGLDIRLDAGHLDAVGRAFAAVLDCIQPPSRAIQVTVDGELPLGVGLGSSAAFAVAVARAVADHAGRSLSVDETLAAGHAAETVFHGTPSGLDHTVCTLGGCLLYRRHAEPRFTPLAMARPLDAVLAWTPRAGSTRQAVESLRARRDASPVEYDALFAYMGQLADAGRIALADGDAAQIGRLFDLNHGCLNACGVSTPALEQMVQIARGAGALGAKLTGAGNGGAVIAITAAGGDSVRDALRRAGFEATSCRIGG
jgi:mevalonate kinase